MITIDTIRIEAKYDDRMQTTVDTKWFQDRLKDKRLSQRKAAHLLGMDPATFSLLLAGKRKMNIDRATEIARLIGVPLATVVAKAGVIVNEATGARSLPVVGWINGDSVAELDWNEQRHRVDAHGDLPPDTVAIQWRTTQSVLDICDGWLLMVTPPREVDPAEDLGRWGLVGIKGGKTVAAKIARGYTPGHYNLLAFAQEPARDVEVAWFAPACRIVP